MTGSETTAGDGEAPGPGRSDSPDPVAGVTGAGARAGDRAENDADGRDPDDPVEARLADALERVAHGATVSVPSIVLHNALNLAFTAVLTNGFAAGGYGLFVLARRIQGFLVRLSLGMGRGLSRYLPNAESAAERDALATFASVLLVGAAAVLGAALYLATPLIVQVTGEGARFGLYLRIFAAGLPASVWLFTVVGILRGLEEVGAVNLAWRVGFPLAQLAVGAVGAYLLDDLAAVAVGVVVVMGLTGTVTVAWAARERGLRPRLRGPDVGAIRRRYLRYTLPLFVAGFATVTQRLGFYPLIALYLSGVAGGVFAVGVLVGGLVRLPLMGINQFISPVAADLHDANHREALSRLYHVTSRLVLVGVTALGVPTVVFRASMMGLFGPTFVAYAHLLPWFVLAQYGACAAGSVGILLAMTDNQRALLVTNVAITAFLVVTAVPLTVAFGLPGLVGTYFLMLTVNNGLEVAVLYRLEGLQPFTRLHAKPLVAGIPLAAVALACRATLPGALGPVVGTAGGLAAYALVLRLLGFTAAERRLGATLVARYREAIPGS